MSTVLRVMLAITQALVSLTALAGGIVLVASATLTHFDSSWAPPSEYLSDSPFDSYLIPGVTLIIFLRALQALGFVLTVRRACLTTLVASLGGFAILVWILVQMIYIPFSLLQIAYFALGISKIVLVLLQLGVVRLRSQRLRRSALPS